MSFARFLQKAMALDTNQLGTWVRNWVHYDNLVTGLNKQIQNARKLKDDFETHILNNLRDHKMENAVIQIVGGRLHVGEERHANSLTLSRIEELLQAYYKSKGRESISETAEIMKFIKAERGHEVTKKLKKQAG
jgi:hypothetical protein